MPIIREKIAATKAPKAKRKPVQVNSQAAAEAVKRGWRTQDAIRDVNARTLALAEIVEKIPGVAEQVENEERRKALALEWAENPKASILYLHSLSTGLYGADVADCVLMFGGGTDNPLDVAPDLRVNTLGKFLRLVMPSLYSRRDPLSEKQIANCFKILGVDPLSDAETEELRTELWEKADHFAGWNVADISPNAIAIGIYNRAYGFAGKAPKNGDTFESMGWDSPWHVDDFLYSGLTRATVGDWSDPCPVGLIELHTMLERAGDDFGTRDWVLHLGAFNRAKFAEWYPEESVVRFESVPAASTLKTGVES